MHLSVPERRAAVAPALLGLAVAVAAPPTPAATMNRYDNASLVPYVEYTDADTTTAVGITASVGGTVYWSFFDGDGDRRARGAIKFDDDERKPFIWAAEAQAAVGAGLAGEPGFLVFALDTDESDTVDGFDENGLKTDAFFVDRRRSDVAFIPTVSLDHSFLRDDDPDDWDDNPVAEFYGLRAGLLPGGARPLTGATVDFPYLIDGRAGGDDTTVYIFATGDMGDAQKARIFDGDGADDDIDLTTPDRNLSVIDLETVNDIRPQFYGDGYIEWDVPEDEDRRTMTVFVFTLIRSDAFGAVQTLIGGW